MGASSQTQSKLPWAPEAMSRADETDGPERISSRMQSAGSEQTRPSQLVRVDPKQLRLDAYMHHSSASYATACNNNCAPMAEPPAKRAALSCSDASLVGCCAASLRIGATASITAESDLQLITAIDREGNPASPRESSQPTRVAFANATNSGAKGSQPDGLLDEQAAGWRVLPLKELMALRNEVIQEHSSGTLL